MDSFDFSEFINGIDPHTSLGIAIIVVAIAICIVAIISLVVSIFLAIKYVKYNKQENSAGLTGEETARRILDQNGLQNIKVKAVGSMLFGNSYSHYFKKVRLRRRTKHKTSLASLGMGAQKAALAVLDKEGDPDMKKRIHLTPLVTFGPFFFIPLIVVGAILDFALCHTDGILFIVLASLGGAFYLLSLIFSIFQLKTEKKAQDRAYELLRSGGLANEKEIAELKGLFKLYNIQYINDIILSALELLYYILQIVAAVSGNSTTSRSNN